MNEKQYYFKEPLLSFSLFTSKIIRIIIWSFYFLWFAVVIFCFTLLGNEFPFFYYLGALLALPLIDWYLHFRQARYPLTKEQSNLANYLVPQALPALQTAYHRALFFKGDFYLYLLKELLDFSDVQEAFRRLE